MSREALLEVRELGLALGAGEQASGRLCPFCKGGHSKELTFSATRTPSGVIYQCHRASCSRKGIMPLNPTTATSSPTNTRKPSSPVSFNLRMLPDEVKKELQARYRISPEMAEQARFMWDIDQQRVWMPILGLNGISVGANLRSLAKGAKPKSRIVVTSPNALLAAFYQSDIAPDSSTIFFVEDQMSAVRISQYHHCVALLGTNISDSLIGALKLAKMSKVVVILDKDAHAQALKAHRRLAPMFGSVIVLRPSKDPKDMTEEELQELLKEA